jgi:hypothetical protein
MACNSRGLTDLTVKPRARRNIQLHCAEFVPLRGARRAIRSEQDERDRTYSRAGDETIIPSKLNGKSENYLPPAPSIYAEGATNARETSHNLRVGTLYGGWSCCGKQFLHYWRQ